MRKIDVRTTKTLSCWVAFALSLVSVYVAIANNIVSRELFYNADALYLPALVKDLTSGIDISGWQLPPAPYFFPDMLLYALLHILLPNFHMAVMAYVALQGIIFLMVLILIGKKAFPGQPLDQTTLLAGAACYTLIATGDYAILENILLASFHFGSVLNMALALLLLVTILDRTPCSKSSWSDLTALFFLAAISVTSDYIFILVFIIPSLLALALMRRKLAGHCRPIALVGATIAGSAVAGVFLHRMIITIDTTRIYIRPGFSGLQTGLAKLWELATQLVDHHVFLTVLWGIFMMLTLTCFTHTLKCLRSKETSTGLDLRKTLVRLFFPLTIACNIIGVLVGGTLEARYLGAAVFLPLFWGWPLLLAAYGWGRPEFSAIVAHTVLPSAAILILLSLPGTFNIACIAKLENYYPDYVDCLDAIAAKRDLKNGISNYWQAKPIRMLSRQNLNVVQVSPDLRPLIWINNTHWYEGEFQFAVLDSSAQGEDRLLENGVITKFGLPSSRFACGSKTIVVYSSEKDDVFREQFTTSPFLVSFNKHGDKAILSEEDLSVKKVPTEWSDKGNNLNQQRLVTATPPYYMPRGTYRVSAACQIDADDSGSPAASWEVVVKYPFFHWVLERGKLEGTGSRLLEVPFSVGYLDARRKVTFKVCETGHGRVNVREMEITRLD